MSLLIPQAHAQAAGPGPSIPFIEPLLLVGFVAIFYFMIWRPSAKQRKDRDQLISGLDKGDEIVTAGGLTGTVVRVESDFVLCRVSEGIQLRFSKSYVTATLPKGTLKQLDTDARQGGGGRNSAKGGGKGSKGARGRSDGAVEAGEGSSAAAAAADEAPADDVAGTSEKDERTG